MTCLLFLFLISEISKNEDTLKEYMLYKQFLDSLTPQASLFLLSNSSCIKIFNILLLANILYGS